MGTIATLPQIAAKINEWFPEVKGRAFAVADSDITPQNMPTLPCCMVALLRAPAGPRNTIRTPAATDNIAIEFWFEPIKSQKADGSESPFYAFYDYEKIRKRLGTKIAQWSTEGGNQLKYSMMDVEATPFAVIIQFTYLQDIFICTEDDLADDPDDGLPFDVCVTFVEGD